MIRFLIKSIKYLGLRNGIKYFKIYLQCKDNPSHIKIWINNCRQAAKVEKDYKVKFSLEFWANELERHLNKTS